MLGYAQQQVASGVGHLKEPFSMLGCATLVHHQMYVDTPNSCPVTESMSRRTKKRTYEQRIRGVKHASFDPLVISATAGFANEASIFHKRLASMLASKMGSPLKQHFRFCCHLAFPLLCSVILSIRGAQSSCEHTIKLPIAVNIESTFHWMLN